MSVANWLKQRANTKKALTRNETGAAAEQQWVWRREEGCSVVVCRAAYTLPLLILSISDLLHPRDDLSGMDVARKALILARLLGQRIDLDNIKVESLYPEEMGPNLMHVEDFLVNGLPLLDKGIQERVERASSNGNVLRYVCVIEDSRATVMWVDEQDGEAIELAFSKKKIEARKNWLRQFESGTYLDQKEKLIKYSDFVNKELILMD
ncbi:unnamed protein product [Camellia sinensis]